MSEIARNTNRLWRQQCKSREENPTAQQCDTREVKQVYGSLQSIENKFEAVGLSLSNHIYKITS